MSNVTQIRHYVLRVAVFFGLVAALLWPTSGRADHDRVPDSPLPTNARLLSYSKLDPAAVTVSGLSSGGFFAHQFHIAYSELVQGAGIIAGGPFGCVEKIFPPFSFVPIAPVTAAVSVCTHYSGALPYKPRVKHSLALIQDARDQGIIDDPANLADDRVWLFLGRKDRIVPAGVVETLEALYKALGIPETRLRHEPNDKSPFANHGIPVEKFTGKSRFIGPAGPPPRKCGEYGFPFVIECGYEAARLLLRHLYAGGFRDEPGDPHEEGRLVGFDQREFFDQSDKRASLHSVGYLYVPKACENPRTEMPTPPKSCRLHIAFHGCRQTLDRIHDDFIRDAGYNRWAATNNIIVLYPQTTNWSGGTVNPLDPPNVLANPNGCWDFWGYSGPGYYGRNGTQMRAVKRMVDRVLGRS